MEQLEDWYAIYGASMWSAGGGASEMERLLNEFEAHEASEQALLKRSNEIVERIQSPLNKFLLKMIISDEERHHAVIHAMASTLKGDLLWTKRKDALQDVAEPEAGRQEILNLAKEFIRLEKEGIKNYQRLMTASKGYYHGLLVLLLQTMVRDSEKHIDILEFLRKRHEPA